MASLVIHQGWRRTAPWVVQGGAGRAARLGPRGGDWQVIGKSSAAADAARGAACPTLHLRRAPSILDGSPGEDQAACRGSRRRRDRVDLGSWKGGSPAPSLGAGPADCLVRWEE